jgi:hypothetical protein
MAVAAVSDAAEKREGSLIEVSSRTISRSVLTGSNQNYLRYLAKAEMMGFFGGQFGKLSLNISSTVFACF